MQRRLDRAPPPGTCAMRSGVRAVGSRPERMRVIVVGAGPDARSTFAYDPATGRWSRRAPSPLGLRNATAFQAGGRALASRGLAPCIRLWRQKRARSASVALPAASQGGPTFWPRSAQVRACHLLLESARLARADGPRRGGFTCHEMRAYMVSWATGNHHASAWSAGGEPAPTHNRSCLPSFPVPCPAASRWCPALLC